MEELLPFENCFVNGLYDVGLQSQLLWRLRWEVNSENISKSAEDIAQCGSVLVLHV